MIKITVEVLPGGNYLKRKTIGHGFIINTGEGTPRSGIYTAEFYGELVVDRNTTKKKAIVTDFDRMNRDVWELLKEALNAENIMLRPSATG
jgi:hypothetical protein